ncbi:hypothetical protein [Geobacter sp.]|uniref:hypothetical protein n=1 Tax=Geobacter sp. TaxID=46610 RepID=UPI00260BF221|nr:hypothetical protein [Geobacter sp.]
MAEITGAPQSPTRLTSATITVSGYDIVAYQYWLDYWKPGTKSAITPVSEAVPLANIPDGPHTIYVVGRDSSGVWQADADASTSQWTVDTKAPELLLSTLTDGAVTGNPTLNIAGSVSDENGVKSLTINGAGVGVNTNGSFSYPLQLNAGANAITTVATDRAGNWSSNRRTVTLDLTPPTLVITSPADNSVTSKSSVDVTGTVDETATVEMRVNGGAPQLSSPSGNNFTVTANLANGINTIEISATDSVGNAGTSQKRTITYDDQAPSLELTYPLQDIRSAQPTIRITGTVSDALTKVSVTVARDGTVLNVFKDLTSGQGFEQDVTFTEDKLYHVTVTASDEAGNSASVPRNIIHVAQGKVGDITKDDKVDMLDVIRALKISTGLAMPTADDILYGDVSPMTNGTPLPDGRITIGDVLIILKLALKLITL